MINFYSLMELFVIFVLMPYVLKLELDLMKVLLFMDQLYYLILFLLVLLTRYFVLNFHGLQVIVNYLYYFVVSDLVFVLDFVALEHKDLVKLNFFIIFAINFFDYNDFHVQQNLSM